MRVKLLPVVALSALLLGACSVPKDVAYVQGVDSLTPEQKAMMNQSFLTLIAPDDQLTITVTAPDPTVTTPFNPPVYSYAQSGDQPINGSQTMYTYMVEKDGNINFPVLGKVRAAGLSRQQLADNLQQQLSKYIDDPLVNVQINNFKITVLGEVVRPNIFTVKSDRISIIDAFGYVGDMTINANRKNILLIRDNNGQKEFARLDMTDPAIFASPYFYLKQNDVIYVEPNDAKKRNAHYSQSQSFNVTLFSTILSGVSIITSMVITIINVRKNNK